MILPAPQFCPAFATKMLFFKLAFDISAWIALDLPML
jgi:hypothetical protein